MSNLNSNLFEYKPQFPEAIDDGAEPSLREMIMHYYTSHDIRPAKAASFTIRYIDKIIQGNQNA